MFLAASRLSAQSSGTWPRGLLVSKDPQTGYVEAFEYVAAEPVNGYVAAYKLPGGQVQQVQNSAVVEDVHYPPSASQPVPRSQVEASLGTLESLTRRYPRYATIFAASEARLRTVPTPAPSVNAPSATRPSSASASPAIGSAVRPPATTSPAPGTIASLVLRDGTRYEDVTVLHVESDRLTIRHRRGITEVLFRDVPGDAKSLIEQGAGPAWQSSIRDAQRQANSLYPDLSSPGSQMNSRFAEAYHKAQQSAAPIFASSDWPLILAIRAADALKRSNNPPSEKKPLPEETDAVVAAAEKGDPDAEFLLGHWYFVGRNMPHDTVEGKEWLMKAAAQGNDNAACTLGDAWAYGWIGGRKDALFALHWYTEAAEHGYPPAIRVLSMCYDDGFLGIVQPGRVEAYKWLSLAAAYGDSKEDVKTLLTFQSKMTPDEIKEGTQRLAEMISHKVAH